MSHEPRLTRELTALLRKQRVAALGTVDENGAPFVSMVPFAVEPASGGIVIHVSGLAAHTQYMQARPMVSILVMQSEVPGEPVHALQRATLQGFVVPIQRDSAQWQACRTAYLDRFPDAEPMTQLGDFRFVLLNIQGARQVAGFGAARSIDQEDIRKALIASTNTPAA